MVPNSLTISYFQHRNFCLLLFLLLTLSLFLFSLIPIAILDLIPSFNPSITPLPTSLSPKDLISYFIKKIEAVRH